MSSLAKPAVFALGLVAVFGAATVVGAAAGPVGKPVASAHDGEMSGERGAGHGSDNGSGHGSDHAGEEAAPASVPGGLQVSEQGYTLALGSRTLRPGRDVPLTFQVQDTEGEPVTGYTRSHGKDLHLIVVRRDLTGYQHVHPELAADGTWSVPVDVPRGGQYRVFADFLPSGLDEGLTLGADLSVPGRYDPAPQSSTSSPAATSSVDGYDVRIEGDLDPGRASLLEFEVSRNGVPVKDLQPYLGASGHLVALRDGDLAYLHVHPAEDEAGSGPTVSFYAEVPSRGDYRLFLDFKHDGVVHTAEFRLTAGEHGH